MTVRHADPSPTPVHACFLAVILQVHVVFANQSVVPDWLGVLDEIASPSVK